MEPLFKSSIGELIKQSKLRIAEIEADIAAKEKATFEKVKAASSLAEMQTIIRSSSAPSKTVIEQFVEDLEYFEACGADREVYLTKHEWKHYYQGLARPELI